MEIYEKEMFFLRIEFLSIPPLNLKKWGYHFPFPSIREWLYIVPWGKVGVHFVLD